MSPAELKTELEKLSNNFKSLVSEHFEELNIDIRVEHIDFSIAAPSAKSYKIADVDSQKKGKSSIPRTICGCRRTPDGQIIC